MTDDRDALRAAFSALSENARPRDDCPKPEALLSAVKLELVPRERQAIVDHMSRCASCAEDWRLASELNPVAVAEGAEKASFFESLAALWRNPSFLGAAAALTLLVAVGVYLRQTPNPIYRDPGQSVIRSLVPEDAPLSREQCVLRWSPGPEGARYDVRVTTEGLAPISMVEGLTESELRIGSEDLVDLPAGATLLWQVVMGRPDGSQIRSETFVSQLK